MRRLTAAAVVALALAGCSSSDDSSTTTTTPATTTTLPASTETTTTVPARAAIEVNACRLLRQRELEPLIGAAGRGEPSDPAFPETEGEVPVLLLESCSWPSVDDPQLELTYLAPTSAADGPSHLQDVLDTGTRFAEGGRVLSEESGAEVVGVLLDAHDNVVELATVHRAALVYLLVDFEVPVRDRATLEALEGLVVTALSRAPR